LGYTGPADNPDHYTLSRELRRFVRTRCPIVLGHLVFISKTAQPLRLIEPAEEPACRRSMGALSG
jgi:hypothetical protein